MKTPALPIRRPTVLLHHRCGTESHYDWMIEDPGRAAGEGRLLTWRVAWPSSQWMDRANIMLEQIGMHRRAYLEYEGPISRNRGSVVRVDEGEVTFHDWHAEGGTLEIKTRCLDGRWRLQRHAGRSWQLFRCERGTAAAPAE